MTKPYPYPHFIHQLQWVSSDRNRRNSSLISDLYLVPPVGEYGTLEYEKMDIIVEKGYNYAKPIVDEWVKQNPWLISNGKRAPKLTTSTSSTSNDEILAKKQQKSL